MQLRFVKNHFFIVTLRIKVLTTLLAIRIALDNTRHTRSEGSLDCQCITSYFLCSFLEAMLKQDLNTEVQC